MNTYGYSLKKFVRITSTPYLISPTWVTDGHLAVRRDRFDVLPSESTILALKRSATVNEIEDKTVEKVIYPIKEDDVALHRTDIVFTAETVDIRLYFCGETHNYCTLDRRFADFANASVVFKNSGVATSIRSVCRTEDGSIYMAPLCVGEEQVKELTNIALYFNSLKGKEG